MSSSRAFVALLALAFPAARLSAQAAPPKPEVYERADDSGRARLRVSESVIGFDDPATLADSLRASPDGRRLAYVVLESGGVRVVVDGVAGEPFEGFATDSLVFGPDGRRVGYVGTRPGKQCVVLDGVLHEYEGVAKQGLVFSSKGTRVGWVASRAGRQFAVIDGEEGPPYDGIAPQGIVFSEDERRVGYRASSAGKSLVVVDGVEGPLFDAVRALRFTSDGKRAFYLGLRGKQSFVVVDETIYGPYDELKANRAGGNDPFELATDHSRLGFVARRGKEWLVVLDGKEVGPFEKVALLSIGPLGAPAVFVASRGDGWITVVGEEEHKGRIPEGLTFSSNGKRMAWTLKRGDERLVQVDGVDGKLYTRIQAPGLVFSADGAHHAYVGERGEQKFLVYDGEEGKPIKRMGKVGLAAAPVGPHLFATIVRAERELFWLDGAEGPAMAAIQPPVFSPDGKRHAYVAERAEGGFVVVLDGVAYGSGGKLSADAPRPYRAVGRGTPVFSADGTRVAWSAEGEHGQVVVVDGVESSPYQIVMPTTLSFSPDGRHVVFAGQRDNVRRLVVDGFEFDNGWDGFRQQPKDLVWHDAQRFSVRALRAPRYVLLEVEIL